MNSKANMNKGENITLQTKENQKAKNTKQQQHNDREETQFLGYSRLLTKANQSFLTIFL